MIDLLRRKTAKRQLITITGTDQHGIVRVEQRETVIYPKIINWILGLFIKFPRIKGNIHMSHE